MKRTICLFLTAVFFAGCMSISSGAASAAEVVPLPKYEQTLPPTASTELSCQIYCKPGGYAEPLMVDCYVTPGVTTLTIESCTWAPQASNICVGFYPSDSMAQPFGVRFTGGSIYYGTVGTSSIPAGMYWIFVCNEGPHAINGTINFSISG